MHRVLFKIRLRRPEALPDRTVAELLERTAGMPGLNDGRLRPDRQTAQKIR